MQRYIPRKVNFELNFGPDLICHKFSKQETLDSFPMHAIDSQVQPIKKNICQSLLGHDFGCLNDCRALHLPSVYAKGGIRLLKTALHHYQRSDSTSERSGEKLGQRVNPNVLRALHCATDEPHVQAFHVGPRVSGC